MIRRLTVAIGVVLVLGIGCTKLKKEEPPPPPASPLAQALQQAGQAADQAGQTAQHGQLAARAGAQTAQQAGANLAQAMRMMGGQNPGGPHVEPVNFRELKALLPDSLPGYKRTAATGEKAGAMGVVVSQANADYSGDGGARLSIKMMDIGSMAGPLALGLTGWASVEIDRETETGYEKSTVIGGHKAFEKYDNRSKHGEVNVLVGQRFIVEVKGRDVKVDDLKAAVGKLDLAKLASLK